jgi:hypothetical protein
MHSYFKYSLVVNSVFHAVAVLSTVLAGHDAALWREKSVPISGIECWSSSHCVTDWIARLLCHFL